MTLDQAKELLEENNIDYLIDEYVSEKKYIEHVYMYPDLENAEDCSVIVLVIPCQNKVKNLELQFNEEDGEYYFVEIVFGEFCFEMFDHEEEFFIDDLMGIIFQVITDQLAVIVRNDLEKKRWVGDACFYLSDDDPIYGEPGFLRELSRIQMPKNIIEQKLTSKKQYEIYTYNTYQQIIR